jgi:hypothetical protein
MKRFTLNIEYCGHPQPRPVIRYCGAFVASYESYNEAQIRLEILQAAAEWVPVQSRGNVNLYASNTLYRVAYGADVTDHATYAAAASCFDSCVRHDKECN